jgi:hypothetical protein
LLGVSEGVGVSAGVGVALGAGVGVPLLLGVGETVVSDLGGECGRTPSLT